MREIFPIPTELRLKNRIAKPQPSVLSVIVLPKGPVVCASRLMCETGTETSTPRYPSKTFVSGTVRMLTPSRKNLRLGAGIEDEAAELNVPADEP